MTVFALVAVVFGLVGVVFGVSCYLNTRKWARLCKRSRIVIAYNRRVKLNATLLEFIDWISSLDEGARGREIFRGNKVSVSILKQDTVRAETKTKTVREDSQQERTAA